MSIYAISIFQETQYHALGIKDPDSHKKAKLISMYQDFIVFNQNSTKFIGMMRKDLIQFFHLKNSKDLMKLDIEDNTQKKLFIREFKSDFEPLFNVISVNKSNVSVSFITKYAIMDWLNKLSLMGHLLEGKLKGVH